MAHKKSDDQLLRKVFDVAYDEIDQLQKIDHEEVKAKLQRTVRVNRQILSLSIAAVVIALVIVVVTYALSMYLDYLAWENRPSFAERVVAPYGMESQLPPYLLNAVTVDAQIDASLNFVTANISHYPISERPPATYANSEVVQLQSIVPTTIGDFTLQWDRQQSTMLSKCLILTGTDDIQRCGTMTATAEFIEMANFKASDGSTLGLILLKYATNEEAEAVMDGAYHYARRVGRIGNFALTNMNEVDYFYSATRAANSYTWLNHNWVMSVSADSFESIDAFMTAFPLYENNPELNQIVVEQIPPSTPEPVIEEPPAVAPEATAEATDEVAGAEATEAVENTEVGASD